MASVSFGYGLFQLCMSLLPPSLLKIVHILGLQGDRIAGLTALMFTRKSDDMRAPLATYVYLILKKQFTLLSFWEIYLELNPC